MIAVEQAVHLNIHHAIGIARLALPVLLIWLGKPKAKTMGWLALGAALWTGVIRYRDQTMKWDIANPSTWMNSPLVLLTWMLWVSFVVLGIKAQMVRKRDAGWTA
jgi:hypothetical protein